MDNARCSCVDCSHEYDMCGVSLDPQINMTLGSSKGTTPTQVGDVYTFTGADGSGNVIVMTDSVKESVMGLKDHFSISGWVKVETDTGLPYIFSIEDGSQGNLRDRYFSWLLRDDRLNIFYLRDRLPELDSILEDGGIGTRVGMSFDFTSFMSNTLYDGKWHFLKLDIDFPQIRLYVDGYLLNPSRGHYYDASGATRESLESPYDMPAPIWNDPDPSDFIGRIGGSQRSNNIYNLKGSLRLFFATGTMDNSQYTCIASCNTSLAPSGFTPGSTDMSVTIGDFNVFYQPVTRTLTFTYSNGSVSVYDSFLKSIIYTTNGYLPPLQAENMGEGRRLKFQISDETGFGSVSQVAIYGDSNEYRPVLNAQGDPANPNFIDFTTTFTEGVDTSVFIVSSNAFFTDQDLDAVIVNVTITLTNAQHSADLEYLSVESEVITVEQSAHQITLISEAPVNDPSYVTALLNVEYNNLADEPLATTREILISVFDGRNYNDPLTKVTINIVTFDDAPIIEPSGEQGNTQITAEYNEGTGKDEVDVLAPNLVVRDSDNENLVSASIYIEEIFDADNELVFVNTTTLEGTGVVCEPVTCEGEYLELSGEASPNTYQDILRSLKYVNMKQVSEFPSLFDRTVKLSVSDGNSNSSSDAEIIVDVLALNQRVIVDLDTPAHNYFINYTEESGSKIKIVGNSRTIDVSLQTLKIVQINIRNPAFEDGEVLILDTTCVTDLGISAENLQTIDQILFSGTGVTTDEFRMALDCITYRNTELEPKNVTRYIDFLFVPGGGAPNDTAVTEISFIYFNDNSPVCALNSNYVDLPEDTKVGEVFFTVEATDLDEGFYDSAVGYEFLSGNEQNKFTMSTSNGIASLSLNSAVNFESNVIQYPVVIQACDTGSPKLCCNYTITFNVSDANDNTPMFANEPITVNVNENSEQLLTTFIIEDADSGINEELSALEIQSSSPSGCMGLFETNLSPPTLSTINGGLDFESIPVCYVVVVATDAGVPMLSTLTNVTVFAIDQDDKSPVLLPPFVFTVAENNSVPHIVGTVTAMDADSDLADLVYSLIDHDLTMFSISNDGELSILFVTDLSLAELYSVTVRVSDPANNVDTRVYNISILPVNNDPPSLVLNSQPVTFTEESGQPVTLISDPVITDPDEVVLSIDRIYATIANGDDSTKETLSVKSGAPSHSLGSSSDPFEIIILPSNQVNISEIKLLIQSIEYLNTQDEPSECRSDKYTCTSTTSRTILVSVSDTTFTSNKEESIVNFEFTNDPPAIDLDTSGDRIINYREGDDVARLVNSLAYDITDDDSENLQSLSCTLLNALDGMEESLLYIGDVSSDLSVSGNDSHFIEITGTSALSNYRSALNLLFYYSSSQDPDTSIVRTVSCIVSDNQNTSEPSAVTITYQNVNDVPHVALNLNSISYQEEMGKVLISNSPSITDIDDTSLSSMTISIEGFVGSGHILSLGSQPPLGIESTVSNTLIVLNGVANIQAYTDILAGVTYENTDSEFNVLETFNIEVSVMDSSNGTSAVAEVEVTLTALDDNPPVFDDNEYELSVSETSPIGSVILELTVSDLDKPIPETPSFSFTDGNSLGHFKISNSANNSLIGSLSIKQALDYHVQSSYTLVVKATSGTFSDSVTINITLINENDKDIFFSSFPNTFSVQESDDTPRQLTPSSVQAEDPDGFLITFSVNSPYVSINSITGELTTIPPVDREGSPGLFFTIVVTATDQVSSVTREANVTVLDLNEFPPEFIAPSYSILIEENSEPPSDPIVTVKATDADETPDLAVDGTKITYSLTNSTYSNYFSLNSTTGDLYLLTKLDFELANVIELEVTASDNDDANPRTKSVLVLITVNNINDEQPYFINFPFEYIVNEFPLTNFDLTIQGADPDVDNLLYYNLSSKIEDLPFMINVYTGKIMLHSDVRLDADAGIREYLIAVTLEDIITADEYMSVANVTENMTIIVQDVNDNAPEFQKTRYTENVIENVIITDSIGGDPLLTVTAVDHDYGFDHLGNPNGNNNVTYSLISAPTDTFKIDAITGTIYILQSPNREINDEYIFYVVASDNPINDDPSTNTVPVVITVLDVNEHPPVADPMEYFVTIDEDIAGGTALDTQVSVQWSTIGE